MPDDLGKFDLIGIVTCCEFQKCRCYLNSLHHSFPSLYATPNIRPMLNVEWNEYLTKMQRKVGGKLWSLKADCVVFLNFEVMGGDAELLDYLSRKFKLTIKQDFHKLGDKHLQEILTKTMESGRKFVYMTLAVNMKVIGTILVLLYADFVPRTVKHFLRCCRHWSNTRVHRIVDRCWIQCEMFNYKRHRLPCENYIVRHDRRGVFSTCNSSKHTDNTLQFNVSLNPTPWMDYKYVAFGQLVQGDEVLSMLETIPNCDESPSKDIVITTCGEFKLTEDVDEKTIRHLDRYLLNKDRYGKLMDVADDRDVCSELSITRYQQGLYCLSTDMISRAHWLLPEYLSAMYKEPRDYGIVEREEGEEGEEEVATEGTSQPQDQDEMAKAHLSGENLLFTGNIYSHKVTDPLETEDINYRWSKDLSIDQCGDNESGDARHGVDLDPSFFQQITDDDVFPTL